jgi:predicted CopG family antitoxin
MNENEPDTSQKTVRIKEPTYNRLSELGTVKETFNDVIERLISFYEAHNTGLHSSSIQVLKESVDFPVEEEYRQFTLQLFEDILSIGDNVSFTLRMDPKVTPLIESRMNNIIFYRGSTALCLVRFDGAARLHIPSEKEDATFPGWKYKDTIVSEFDVNSCMKVIKHLYEFM